MRMYMFMMDSTLPTRLSENFVVARYLQESGPVEVRCWWYFTDITELDTKVFVHIMIQVGTKHKTLYIQN